MNYFVNLINFHLYYILYLQAIKVSMHLVPPNIMTTEIAQKIFSIIGNDKILVNLISVPANDVPCIQLHKFKEDSPDIPLCINIQLAQR